MKDLKFFKRFERDVRFDVLYHSTLDKYPARHVLFRQGDIGDYMYIIIQGSVEVRLKSPELGNQEVPYITLYDGDHFGELGSIKSTQQQKALAEEWGKYDMGSEAEGEEEEEDEQTM